MYLKTVFILLISLLLSSCVVSQNKYDTLKNENNTLKELNSNLKDNNADLEDAIITMTEENLGLQNQANSLDFEKQKYDQELKDKYAEECEKLHEIKMKKLNDFTNKCTSSGNSLDFCMQSETSKFYLDDVHNFRPRCMEKKEN